MSNEQPLMTEFGANVLAVLGAVACFRTGYLIFSAGAPTLLQYALTTASAYALGLVLLVLAVLPVDLRRRGRALGAIVIFTILLGYLTVYFGRPVDEIRFGTDSLLFSRYSVHLLLEGVNPYAESMTPAIDLYEPDVGLTRTVDGGHVSDLSYPAVAVIAYVPQGLTGIGRETFHLTNVVLTAAAVGLCLRWTPSATALGIPAWLLGLGLWTDAFGGLIDALWLLPLLIAIRYWSTDDLVVSGVAFGVACAAKQQPWLIGPFLVVWLLVDGGWREGRRRVLEFTGAAAASFLAVNLPFLVWSPTGWLESVVAPVFGTGAPLIHQGVGPAIATWSGLVYVPRWLHGLGLGIGFIAGLGAYAWGIRREPRVGWVAWLAAPLLLFFHYRSLPSYFIWYVPVAWVVAHAAADELALPSPDITSAKTDSYVPK